MAYQVLSRKWRPKKFQDVVGQSHITESLVNALKLNKLGHAYLFTGTRGIGKTTVARIFAKALRCENLLEDGNPCGDCLSCKDFDTGASMNVYEIDGASNNSVDDIRDLIGNVQYLPTTGKYKVYVIDEIHMLSTSAFNALLKTLEEPPEHVIFLFATTEPHKLLETVLSRCQRFDFKNATNKEISYLLNKIANEENIHFENDDVINQLSVQGKGSFRDTLSLLDQVLSFSVDRKITDEILSTALGLAMRTEIKALCESILVGDGNKLRSIYHGMLNGNVSLENILRGLQDHLYKIIDSIDDKEKCGELVNINIIERLSIPELFWIYESIAKDMTWSLKSLSPEDASELAIKKVCFRRDFFKGDGHKIKFEKREIIDLSEEKNTDVKIELDEVKVNEVKIDEVKVETESKIEAPVIKEEIVTKIPEESKTYKSFLEFVFAKSPATASNLEQGNISAEPEFVLGEVVRLGITFAQASKVFYDYLQETEVFIKVNQYLADYYSLPIEKAHLDLTLIEDIATSEEFVSVANIKEKEYQAELKNKENNIRNNPLLKQAEELFSTTVDKVVLNKE